MKTERETTAPSDNTTFRFLVVASLVYLIVVVAAAFLLGYACFARAVAAGGAVALMNLFWLRRHLSQIFCLPNGRGAVLMTQIKLASRLAVTTVLLYVLIVTARLNVAGLVTGLSTLFVAVLVYILVNITRRGENQ